MTDIGENIKKFRLSKNMTQKQLGDLCGMADSAIRRYENGRANPKKETLQKIALALGISEIELLGLSKEEFLKPLKDEVAFLNYLLSLGYEYIDTFHDNEYGYDRCIYIQNENIDIPLTREEYEDFKKSIVDDTEIELYKLRKNKGI